MLILAHYLFPVAVVAGVVLAVLHWTGHRPPLWGALVHGVFAVGGILALVYAIINLDLFASQIIPLSIFFVAAIGGVVLLGFHLQGRKLPHPLIVAHGGAAIFGVFLLFWALRGPGHGPP